MDSSGLRFLTASPLEAKRRRRRRRRRWTWCRGERSRWLGPGHGQRRCPVLLAPSHAPLGLDPSLPPLFGVFWEEEEEADHEAPVLVPVQLLFMMSLQCSLRHVEFRRVVEPLVSGSLLFDVCVASGVQEIGLPIHNARFDWILRHTSVYGALHAVRTFFCVKMDSRSCCSRLKIWTVAVEEFQHFLREGELDGVTLASAVWWWDARVRGYGDVGRDCAYALRGLCTCLHVRIRRCGHGGLFSSSSCRARAKRYFVGPCTCVQGWEPCPLGHDHHNLVHVL